MELLHCAVLLAVLINANGEVSVTVGDARVEVKQGESAELTCSTGVDILFCQFMTPYGESLIMSPEINYEAGRIAFAGEEQKKHCGVKINSVEEKDNGEWKCEITANQGGSAKKGTGSAIVTVVKPPTSVTVDVESSLVLNYPQDSTKEVRCSAEGGRPAPSFAWMLDNEKYNGAVVDEENAQKLTYTSKPEHNGKTLSCVVTHKGFTKEALAAGSNKASIALDIRFQPVASTQDNDFYGMKIGEPFSVLMNFKSNPKPTEFHWKMHDGTIVPMGGAQSRFTSTIIQDGPHAGQYTAKLTIDKVTKEDEESDNVLVVQNELGNATYKFSLGVGERPPVGSNVDAGVPSIDEAGSGPVIAIVIVALIIVIVIVVAVVARAQGILCFADPPKEDDKEKAVEKEEGSDTESAEAAEGAKDDVEAGGDANNKEKPDEEAAINNNTTKKSVSARFSGLFTAMKKTVNSKKEKYAETESEVKLQESEDEKKDGAEKKDDSIVYADLDKSAMSEGKRPSVSVENEKSEYAEIAPQAKE